MEALQLTLRAGVGALQAALRLPEAVEERNLDLGCASLENDAFFGSLDARELPLRDRHLLEVEVLGSRLWLPFGFEVVAELVEVVGIFTGEDDGAGAKEGRVGGR